MSQSSETQAFTDHMLVLLEVVEELPKEGCELRATLSKLKCVKSYNFMQYIGRNFFR